MALNAASQTTTGLEPQTQAEAGSADKARLYTFTTLSACQRLVGEQSANLAIIERLTMTRLALRGCRVGIDGDEAARQFAAFILGQFDAALRDDIELSTADIQYAIETWRTHAKFSLKEIFGYHVATTAKNRVIHPLGISQYQYVQAIEGSDLVFGIGPAGTGKTYLAVAKAFAALHQKKVDRIVLSRPAVEAGEQLGFLPGGFQDKVHPYLRPLYDAAHDMVGVDRVNELIKREIIEIAPLAYMRGRTLNDSFIILDEAQNTTSEQMKMFLTRLGKHSKTVVTGDVTQIDLPERVRSGLCEVQHILHRVKDIRFHYFSEQDVVRHPLVRDIIRAYDQYRDRE